MAAVEHREVKGGGGNNDGVGIVALCPWLTPDPKPTRQREREEGEEGE